MLRSEVPDQAIDAVARHINTASNKNYGVPEVGNEQNVETPQVFEIIPFQDIDACKVRFYAIDGSYSSQQFYNGLAIAVYAGGYVCYEAGNEVRMNTLDDPVILGQSYHPQRILATSTDDFAGIYDELLTLRPVARLLEFWGQELGGRPEEAFAYEKDKVCVNLSTLLGFCQELLELALTLEVAERPDTKRGDFILRDGTLRSLQVKQAYLVTLGKYLHDKDIRVLGVTKQSPIKMELAYTFKQIDVYLQDQLKPHYPFIEPDPRRRKLCCWFEVPSAVLAAAYHGDMFAKKAIHGGRGFGLFTAARLDYVEKLQNYDWVVVDVNIFDAIPGIESSVLDRDRVALASLFRELTRLTQEHYILGYPYPLVEAHNFISLDKDFREEIMRRLKYALYRDQRMDNVDIENLFLDTHDRF
jgi:hypothetical protein